LTRPFARRGYLTARAAPVAGALANTVAPSPDGSIIVGGDAARGCWRTGQCQSVLRAYTAAGAPVESFPAGPLA